MSAPFPFSHSPLCSNSTGRRESGRPQVMRQHTCLRSSAGCMALLALLSLVSAAPEHMFHDTDDSEPNNVSGPLETAANDAAPTFDAHTAENFTSSPIPTSSRLAPSMPLSRPVLTSTPAMPPMLSSVSPSRPSSIQSSPARPSPSPVPSCRIVQGRRTACP